MTRQLLAFSRRQIIQPEILDLNELLTDIEKMLGRLIGEDVELLMIPGPELWQVETDPGKGTTFKVYLPKVKGDVEEEEKEQHLVTELGGSETVLIVEDDDSLRKLARTVLKQRGYSVLEAENGEEALKVSEAHDGLIDLLITDVVMPKISGKETAKRLQPLYPQMKVIYMSGYTDDAIMHHGVLAPGLNFLEKPFSPESLARKVREVLDQD